jgi:hypothetical protein
MANILFVTWDGAATYPQLSALPLSCNVAATPYGSSGMSSNAA